jgi:competence protein ComEC
VAAATAAGAWAGDGADLHQAALLLALGACLACCAWWAPVRANGAAVAAAALAIGAAGGAVERAAYDRTPLRAWVSAAPEAPEPVELVGRAAGDARPRGERAQMVLDVERARIDGEWRPLRGRLRLDVAGEKAPAVDVLEGERVRAWAQLSLPRGFWTPGAFDAAGYAFRDGVHAQGYCKSALLLQRDTVEPGAPRATARLRRWARQRFDALMPTGPERAVVAAMVIGDRSGLDPGTAEEFRAAGTYHVLAISGAQVALLAAVLLRVLRRLRLAEGVSALSICALLAAYAELVGGDTPVVRAAVMAGALLLGRAASLEGDAANLLGLAATGLLVLRPSSIGDLGFQLSFAATLGLLLLTPPLLAGVRALPLRVDLALAASLAAQLALMPLLAGHFQRLSPAAVLLNLAAVPLSAAVLMSGLGLLGCAAVLPPLAPVAGSVTWCLGHALLRSADLVALVPALDVRVPPAPAWAVALHAWALLCLRRRGRAAAALPLAASLAALTIARVAPADGRLHVSVLDVGQGDAIVLRGPTGRVWVVDAGPASEGGLDAGEAVVGPYLRHEGVRRVDRLLVTHAHPDHAGGMPFLLRSFAVGEAWEGPWPRADRSAARLGRALAASGVARRTVGRGLHERWDGVDVRVLWPPRLPRAPWTVRNDDSLVMLVGAGEGAVLLAGDLEREAEAALHPPASPLLKVPHHGSRTSSSAGFLAEVAPRLAVISAGYRNRYGHPHADVLDRLRRLGTRVLRTDLDGTVELALDGRQAWVRTFRDPVFRAVR